MPASLRSFIDAAADAVARAIAGFQREAIRERELREAQFAARMAELDARVSAVAELERRVAERLASLKDGEPGKSVTIDDLAPMVETCIARAVAALPAPKDGEDGRSVTAEDVRPILADLVAEAMRSVPAPRDGKDADPQVVAALVEEHVARAVAAIPPAEPGPPGKSVTEEDVAPMLARMVREAVASLPPAEPGRSVTAEDVSPMLVEMVRDAVSALPPAQPGRDADPEMVRQMVADAVSQLPHPVNGKDADPALVERLVDEKVSAAIAALPPAERGEPGPMGALPIVEEWQDRVHYQGSVVGFRGALYQARRDTGKAPDHDDWSCIVRAGRDGLDGRSFAVRGTWSPDATYEKLDVVALNGAAFVARRDEPGPCPGDGWQMIAMQGKPGKPGPKGDTGMGLRGLPGPAAKSLAVSDDGSLTLTNADGSTVVCDLYPILSKLT